MISLPAVLKELIQDLDPRKAWSCPTPPALSQTSSRSTTLKTRTSKMEGSPLSLIMSRVLTSTALPVKLVEAREVPTRLIDSARLVPWLPLSRDLKFQISTWSTPRPKCSKCTQMSSNIQGAVGQALTRSLTPPHQSKWWFKMAVQGHPSSVFSSNKRAHIPHKLTPRATMEVQPRIKLPMTRTTSTLMHRFLHLNHTSCLWSKVQGQWMCTTKSVYRCRNKTRIDSIIKAHSLSRTLKWCRTSSISRMRTTLSSKSRIGSQVIQVLTVTRN